MAAGENRHHWKYMILSHHSFPYFHQFGVIDGFFYLIRGNDNADAHINAMLPIMADVSAIHF
jgi:hypothetical protein